MCDKNDKNDKNNSAVRENLLITDLPAKTDRPIVIKLYLKYRGILFALLSAIFGAMTNILVKECFYFNGSDQTVIRYFVQFLIMLIIACHRGESLMGEKDQRSILIIRGLMGTVGLTSITFAVKLIDPSDVFALLNCGVILVAIFSRIFLKEKFTIAHLFAVVLTTLGVLLISQPSFIKPKNTIDTLKLNFSNSTEINEKSESDITRIAGIMIALLGTFCASVVSVLLKKLANKQVHYSIAIIYASYFGLPANLALSGVLFFSGVNRKLPLDTKSIIIQTLLALLSGVFGIISQCFMNVSYKYEDATKVSLVRSTDLIFVFLLQYFILDIHSNLYSITGTVLIFAAVSLVMFYKLMDQRYMKRHKGYLDSKSKPIIGDNVNEDDILKPNRFKRILFFKL